MGGAKGSERVLQGSWALFACRGIDEAMLMEASADAAPRPIIVTVTCIVRFPPHDNLGNLGMDVLFEVAVHN